MFKQILKKKTTLPQMVNAMDMLLRDKDVAQTLNEWQASASCRTALYDYVVGGKISGKDMKHSCSAAK